MGVPRSLGYAAALATFAVAQPAQARFEVSTGNELLDTCTDNSGVLVCLAFINGVSRGFTGGLAYSHADDIYCVSQGVTMGQLRDVVVNHLRAHPETRQKDSAFLVIEALADAFPCAVKKM